VLEGVRDPRIPAIVTATDIEDVAGKDNGRVVAVAGRLAVGAAPGATIDAAPYTALPLIDGLNAPEILVDLVEQASAEV